MVLRKDYFSPILWRGELRDRRDAWASCGTGCVKPLPQDSLLTFSSGSGGCSGCLVIRIPKSHTVVTRSLVASKASRVTFLVPRVLRMGGSLRSSRGVSFFFFFCLSLGTGPCTAPAWGQTSAEGWSPFIRQQPRPSPLPTTAP